MVMLISSTDDLAGLIGPVGGPSALGLAYLSVGRAFDSVTTVTESGISLFFRVAHRPPRGLAGAQRLSRKSRVMARRSLRSRWTRGRSFERSGAGAASRC